MVKKSNIKEEQIKFQQKQLETQSQNIQFIQKAIEQGASLLQKYLDAKIKNVEAPKIKWSIIAFVGVLVLVIIICGFLVYENKLDPSNFTFLLGTLIGAVITLLGDVLIPQEN